MISELNKAYNDTFWMLEDGIRKMPEDCWRTGQDDYLIPVRIVYHLLKSFEWLMNLLPREEFLATRKYQLDWLGPVGPMPSRAKVLADLPGLQERVTAWLGEMGKLDPSSPECQERIADALYFLRHAQLHIGEYSIIARLIHVESPEWK